MPESQLALSWDNFQQTMQSGIFHLLETEDLVDVTFCVEGKKLKAHKMILSVCSPFFKELFESNPCQHPIIFLNEVKFRIMKDLLTYMYKGEVLLTQELLPAFVRLGESLQIRGLTNDDSHPPTQPTNAAIDQQLVSQRIFADSLPIHAAPHPKATSTPTIRRTMPRPVTAGIRRPAPPSTASMPTTPDSASGGLHLQMKRPRLTGNKTRFMLDSSNRVLKKIEKIEQEIEEGTEEEDAEDHLTNLEDIQQHNYSFTSSRGASAANKQRRKSTASTTSTSSQPATSASNAIDPMEMELAIIHQGQLNTKGEDQQLDSEDGESQHETEQVIIGGDGGDVDIVLEQEGDEECLQEDGEEIEEEIEHKLMMHTADGEVEIRGEDSIGAAGDEDRKDDEEISYVRTMRKQEMPRYIVDGFVFHVNIMKGNPPMTYLRCLEYKRLGCHARAVMPTNGSIQDIQLTQTHNHPPDFAAEEKIVFMRELKDFLLRHMNIQGPRSYCQLMVQGHRYVKHRSNKKSTYWKCHQYDMGACKARCTISVDNTVALTGNHAHEPEDDGEEHTILVQEIRKLVRHPYANHKRRHQFPSSKNLVEHDEPQEHPPISANEELSLYRQHLNGFLKGRKSHLFLMFHSFEINKHIFIKHYLHINFVLQCKKLTQFHLTIFSYH